MDKQEYKILKLTEEYTSECQMSADEMAMTLINQKEIFSLISLVQSICDFNLSWLYSISPDVIIHKESLQFFKTHLKLFKRKLTVKEMIKYDALIYWYEPKSFEDFKNMIT